MEVILTTVNPSHRMKSPVVVLKNQLLGPEVLKKSDFGAGECRRNREGKGGKIGMAPYPWEPNKIGGWGW